MGETLPDNVHRWRMTAAGIFRPPNEAEQANDEAKHAARIAAERARESRGYCRCCRGEARERLEREGVWPGGFMPDLWCSRCDAGKLPERPERG